MSAVPLTKDQNKNMTWAQVMFDNHIHLIASLNKLGFKEK